SHGSPLHCDVPRKWYENLPGVRDSDKPEHPLIFEVVSGTAPASFCFEIRFVRRRDSRPGPSCRSCSWRPPQEVAVSSLAKPPEQCGTSGSKEMPFTLE